MDKYMEAEHIELVHSGSQYFQVLEDMIDRAEHSLHLQTYIFDTDHTGRKVAAALKRAALRKVEVFVLADAFGSFSFSADLLEELRAAGVHMRYFSPLLSAESMYIGRRLHYKIVVADKTSGLTGGINIADKYNSVSGNAWLDYAVLVKGQVCEYLHLLCEAAFSKADYQRVIAWERSVFSVRSSPGKPLVRFRLNDWLKWKNEVHQSYMSALTSARSSVIIVASYFLPGRKFRKLLSQAASRGVKISIILTAKSDVMSAKLAEHYLYDFFTANKVCLYEWQGSVMHGKAMVIDGSWTTVGSYNLNFLSHYISIELNTDVQDPAFAAAFEAHLSGIMKERCKNVDTSGAKSTTLFKKFGTWIFYSFFRVLMNATVSKRKHFNR